MNKHLALAIGLFTALSCTPTSAQVRVTYSASGGSVVFSVTPNANFPVDCDVIWTETSINTGGVSNGTTTLRDIPGNGTSQSSGEYYRGGAISQPYASCRISQREMQRQQEAANRQQAAEQARRDAEQQRAQQQAQDRQRQYDEQAQQQQADQQRQQTQSQQQSAESRAQAQRQAQQQREYQQQQIQIQQQSVQEQQRANAQAELDRRNAQQLEARRLAEQEAARRAQQDIEKKRLQQQAIDSSMNRLNSTAQMIGQMGQAATAQQMEQDKHRELAVKEKEQRSKEEDASRRAGAPNPFEKSDTGGGLAVTGGGVDREKAREIFSSAFMFWQSGDFETANIAFAEGLQLDPENAKANYYYADSLLKTKNRSKATTYFEKVIKLSPTTVEGYKAKSAMLVLAKPVEVEELSSEDAKSILVGKWRFDGGFRYEFHLSRNQSNDLVVSGPFNCFICVGEKYAGLKTIDNTQIEFNAGEIRLKLRMVNADRFEGYQVTNMGTDIISATRQK